MSEMEAALMVSPEDFARNLAPAWCDSREHMHRGRMDGKSRSAPRRRQAAPHGSPCRFGLADAARTAGVSRARVATAKRVLREGSPRLTPHAAERVIAEDAGTPHASRAPIGHPAPASSGRTPCVGAGRWIQRTS